MSLIYNPDNTSKIDKWNRCTFCLLIPKMCFDYVRHTKSELIPRKRHQSSAKQKLNTKLSDRQGCVYEACIHDIIKLLCMA
jgi:hypothetical protein